MAPMGSCGLAIFLIKNAMLLYFPLFPTCYLSKFLKFGRVAQELGSMSIEGGELFIYAKLTVNLS